MTDPFDEIIGAQRSASRLYALRTVLDAPLATFRYAMLLTDYPQHETAILEAMDVLDQDTRTTLTEQVKIMRRRIAAHDDPHRPVAGEDYR